MTGEGVMILEWYESAGVIGTLRNLGHTIAPECAPAIVRVGQRARLRCAGGGGREAPRERMPCRQALTSSRGRL